MTKTLMTFVWVCPRICLCTVYTVQYGITIETHAAIKIKNDPSNGLLQELYLGKFVADRSLYASKELNSKTAVFPFPFLATRGGR